MPPRFDTLTAWLQWQETLHPLSIDLKLDRIRQVYQRLQLPDKLAPVVITVGGTNGKGSSVALLESILETAGYQVGAYTSPHLQRYNERVRINRAETPDHRFIDAFAAIDQARADITLTYFEFGTLAALYIFHQQPLDVVILEVGMGGRLDATNIIDADVALITSVDLDHQQWLGNDRETIAVEKAGIFREQQAAVYADPKPPDSLLKIAAEKQVNLHCLQRDYEYETASGGWNWQHNGLRKTMLPAPRCAEPIQYQNAAGVLMVLKLLSGLLPVDDKTLTRGLQGMQLKGRFQRIAASPEVILDVAHNPQAFKALAANLQRLPRSETFAVLGVLSDKAWSEMLQILLPHIDRWFLSIPASARGMPARELSGLLQQAGVLNPGVYATVTEAFSAARDAIGAEGRLLVTGSFITVAEVLELYSSPETPNPL